MSAWTYRQSDGKAASKIVPPRLRIPCWKGLGADSEEKREPASDIDTVVVDSLKALDPKWLDVCERLTVGVADDVASLGLLSGPGRREAARFHVSARGLARTDAHGVARCRVVCIRRRCAGSSKRNLAGRGAPGAPPSVGGPHRKATLRASRLSLATTSSP